MLPTPYHAHSMLFFCPIKLRYALHIGIVRFVFGLCGYRKTVGFPNHRRGEERVTKRGFILVLPLHSLGSFSPPHHYHFLYICFYCQ